MSQKEKYKIIFVEDNPVDFDMVKALLEEEDVLDWIISIENRKDFLEAVSHHDFDLILTEYSLSGFHGFEAIHLALERCPDKPIIMITGSLPDEIAIDAIKRGAWDYVLKHNIFRLLPSIRGVMEKKRILDENLASQKALLESEENYRSLAENSPYGIIVHSDGKVKYHNQTALEIFGLPDNLNFINHDVMDFIHPGYKETVKSRIARLYKGESLVDFYEEVFLGPDGKELHVEVSSTAIIFYGQRAAQVIFRDISDRKRMEKQIIEAKEKAEEADRLKTTFLENLSHEIRTPLNGIIGFTNLLKLKEVSQDDQIRYLQVIEDSGMHLLNIINDLIDISKIEAGQVDILKERINLNHLLDELFVFFNDSSRYKKYPVMFELKKALPDDESFIMTDPLRLRQVFINLLGNSFKYTHEGKIEFGYEPEQNKSIKFFVRDSGIGIPEKAHGVIFKRFRQVDESKTRKYGGNGLGLSICKGLVEAMEGKIWFHSVEKQGTEFYFTLPEQLITNPALKETGKDKAKKETDDLSKYALLLAEDEESNYVLIQHLLRPSGIEVIHAKNGHEAIDLLKSRTDISIGLLDIKMPEVDGLELARWIREQGINIPLIAQTAYAMPGDREKCLNAGFTDYIAKPIRIELLLKMITAYLQNP